MGGGGELGLIGSNSRCSLFIKYVGEASCLVHFTSLAVTDNRDSSSILRFSTETLRDGQSSVIGTKVFKN